MGEKKKRVGAFLGSWVSTNVHAGGYKPEGDLGEARALAERCVALAAAQDITRGDLEAEVGDLDEHMRRAQNTAQRLADVMKDPPDGQRP